MQVFLDLLSFARRMKSEKNRLAKTVEPRCNDPRHKDVPGITTINYSSHLDSKFSQQRNFTAPWESFNLRVKGSSQILPLKTLSVVELLLCRNFVAIVITALMDSE